MKEITGETKLFAILADPIHHVKTPQRINEYFERIGYDGVLVPMHVRPDDLSAAVAGLRKLENLGGLIVTVPHKTSILSLCDQATDTARMIGAANIVRRSAGGEFTAHMLDGEGFARGLQACGHPVKGKSVYMVGAGGAANAIAFGLVRHGASRLTIANRTSVKAENLKRRILEFYPGAHVEVGTTDPSGHDIVVNATSLGMNASDSLPLDAAKLQGRQVVCEVIMQPKETALLKAARDRNCVVHYGGPMLASQIELMVQFFGAGQETSR